ncbi:hypothetical protein PVNG_06157 [Plasmodium vivax North Korean]|uniref:Variable surface protein n=1 Tax=Plasmodium vivax North Korean TaxID=1035514 RepID=A0A0J9TN37_PLAVI|nr:hypothetical protein PVNG_06157 [Plasmodium vivax North Korean]
MAACPFISNKYIDYECYDCLKYKFRGCEVTEDGWTYLNNILDSMDTKIHNFTPKNKILVELFKHLTCNRVILHTNTNVACKYINFWLFENVKKEYFHDYNSNFNNFQEFVKKFYKVLKHYSSYKSCTESIKIPDNIEYNKMNTLYTLYQKYDDLKLVHKHTNDWVNTCKNIQYITTQANGAARTYDDDEEFIKVLRHLRDTIKNGTGNYKTICDSNLKELQTMVTEKAFPPKAHKPRTPQGISQQSVSLVSNQPQTLTHVSENGIVKQPETKVDLHESSPTAQLRSEDHFTQVSRAASPIEESRLLEQSIAAHHPRGSRHARSHHAGDSHEDIYEQSAFSGEQYEQSHDTHSSSGILQLDPSLEEEEDDSAKFLVDLEDIHQENSQIFKNMKKVPNNCSYENYYYIYVLMIYFYHIIIIDKFSDFFLKTKKIFDDSLQKNQKSYEEECRTKVSTYSGETDFFNSYCTKSLKYLDYLDEKYPITEDQKQGIIYLYFWLYYYELQRDIYNGNTLNNFKKLMDSYEEIRHSYANIQNVYNIYIKNILNNELHDLFYLYEEFDNLQKNKECTETRRKCAKNCVERYKTSAENCYAKSNKYLCSQLENFREQYNVYMTSADECPEVQSYLPSYQNYSTSVIILISFITISVLSSLLFILYKVITIFIYLFIVQ